jgi:hypothetical protein
MTFLLKNSNLFYRTLHCKTLIFENNNVRLVFIEKANKEMKRQKKKKVTRKCGKVEYLSTFVQRLSIVARKFWNLQKKTIYVANLRF